MFGNEILSKTCRIGIARIEFRYGVADGIGLAYGLAQMDLGVGARRRGVLYMALLDEAHGSSSGLVACLKDARLERSLECRRRERKNGLLLQAYATPSLRAGSQFSADGPYCSDCHDASA